MSQKAAKVLSWVVGIILVLSGLGKIIGFEGVVQAFSNWDLSSWRVLIGIIETILGIILIVPSTAVLASFLLSGFFGGAIAVHLASGETAAVIFPLIFLVLVLIIAHLKKPGIFNPD